MKKKSVYVLDDQELHREAEEKNAKKLKRLANKPNSLKKKLMKPGPVTIIKK